ncbi:hypothetical protein BEP19_16845 [Ammoniphilus oxalaticus]|uniref:Relaxase n=1 Tax=Ammoniphilus oxalaticus TaxID=66863 RepID=A0A419SQA4_9BACL|nr:MobP2 family relaxase [Ammoniphilus oxalaticus]RKD26504.1 hypothetical protein BEP19_16845 [Ammoniphilus oxalaticus]
MNNSPAVIIKSQFKMGKQQTANGSFRNYVNYMDRADTHSEKNEFQSYQDYMSNEEKSTGLFTNEKDVLTDQEKERFKDTFKDMQEKGSVLWQDVISFDNDWLKERGVLQDKGIDEKKLKNVTRSAVNEMLKHEKLLDTTIWTAAIHYNTDNIHIHVATVQTKNFRERGKRKPSSIEKMKSATVNQLLDRSKENERLNQFIRNDLIQSKREDPILSLKNRIVDRELVSQFKKIHSMLPEDKRLWRYNMNGIQHVRPELDKLTDMYIDRHFKTEFEDFKKQLDQEVAVYKKSYGENSKAERYRETKMKDLYTRMGNTILKEVKDFDQKQNKIPSRKGRGRSVHVGREVNRSRTYEANERRV